MKRNETRLTIIKDEKRIHESFNIEIKEEIQDEGRTLKIFLKTKRIKGGKN